MFLCAAALSCTLLVDIVEGILKRADTDDLCRDGSCGSLHRKQSRQQQQQAQHRTDASPCRGLHGFARSGVFHSFPSFSAPGGCILISFPHRRFSGRSWQPPSHRVVSSFLAQYIPTYTVCIIALPRNRFKIFSLGSVNKYKAIPHNSRELCGIALGRHRRRF